MSKKQSLGSVVSTGMANIGSVAPSGAVGIDMTTDQQSGNARPSAFLVTAVVTTAPSDLILWGAAEAGPLTDGSDDVWGLFTDKRRAVIAGKIGSALAVGTHHILVEDVGIFRSLFFTKSAGNIDVTVRPVFYAERGN